jgi:hypothetical protein
MKTIREMCFYFRNKKILQNIIEEEDKKKPLPDDQLAELLKEKGAPLREEPSLNIGNN